MFKKILVAATVCASLNLFAGNAGATAVNCTVTKVAWGRLYGGTAQIYCSNGQMYSAIATTQGTCTGVGIEAVKAFFSLAQSAYLAGKTIGVDNTANTSVGNCYNYAILGGY